MQTEINYSHRLTEIDWSNIKVVIFDFDGTIYDPVRLWKQALVSLCQRKLSLKHIRVFNTYLQMIEKHSGKSIEHHLDIYLQTATHLNCEQKYIEQMVHESRVHLFSDLQQCLYPDFLYFFCKLVNKNISRVIYSDEPLEDKMRSLPITPEMMITATDHPIMQFKPTAVGLLHIMQYFDTNATECLFIGDRYDRDALSAKLVGMPFIILPKRRLYFNPMKQWYKTLSDSLVTAHPFGPASVPLNKFG